MLAYHRQSNEMEVDEVKTAAPLPKEKETALLRYLQLLLSLLLLLLLILLDLI